MFSQIQLSRRDIRFMNIIYKIGSVLACNPCYDFDKKTIINPCWKKIQACTYIIVILLILIWIQGKLVSDTPSPIKTGTFILNLINIICLVALTVCTIANSCLFGQKYWLKLNRNFQYIDEILKNTNRKETFFNNWCFHSSLAISIFLMCDCYISSKVTHLIPGLLFAPHFYLHQYCYGCEFYVCVLICNTALALKCRFADINRSLVSKPLKHEHLDVIKRTGYLWKILSKNVAYFNRIFGCSILLLTGRGILQLLISLQNILVYFNHKGADEEKQLVVANLLIFSSMAIYMTTAIMLCDSVTNESQKLKFHCYEILNKYPDGSKEGRELERLAHEVSHTAIKFTAADFFEINRGTLFQIVNVTMTYFIIVIQFSSQAVF